MSINGRTYIVNCFEKRLITLNHVDNNIKQLNIY